MKLRRKILVVFGIGLLIILTGFALFSYYSLQGSYETIEKEGVIEVIQRVEYAISVEQATLDATLVDWAQWDDTWRFAQDNNSAYRENILLPETFRNLGLDFLFIFNQSGGQVYGQVYNPGTGELEEVPEDLSRVIRENYPLFTFDALDPDTSVGGIFTYDRKSVLVGVRPVLQSSGEGPAAGIMIMGRTFDGSIDNRISTATGVSVSLIQPADILQNQSLQTIQGQFSPETPVVIIPESPDTITGYTLFPELNRTGSTFILGIARPRIVYQTGLAAMYSYLVIVLIGGMLAGIVSMVLIDQAVLSRISSITGDVERIGTGDESGRITEVAGDDEVTQLAKAINQMLEKITIVQQRFRSIVEDQTELICRFNPDGRITFMNPAFQRSILGSDGNPDTLSIHDLLPPEVTKRTLDEFLSGFTPGSPIRSSEQACPLQGKESWISWTIRGIFAHDGGLQEFQFVGRDITEEKTAADKIRQYQDHLEDLVKQRTESLLAAREELRKAERLESIGMLSGNIAHDFNNLLVTILMNIELLEAEAGKDSPLMPRLNELARETLRARSLTQQMLTFSRGGAPIRKAVDIATVVGETVQFVCRGSPAKCMTSAEPDLHPVSVDPDQISQVITNIMVNAMQAMPDGGIIHVNLRNVRLKEGEVPPLPAGMYVSIAITDQGKGINPEHLDRVFEPFFTTKTSGEGLGLASSLSIIRKHDGTITVQSDVGKGTTSTIFLPAGSDVPPGPPVLREVREQPHDPKSCRILIMDDEAEIRKLLQKLFELKGCEVGTAKDGDEALRTYREAKEAGRPFDMVLLDLTIPGGMGGRQTMEALMAYDPGVRAIVSSGYNADPIMADYRTYGFRGVVPKPYAFADLYDLVSRLIQQKEDP